MFQEISQKLIESSSISPFLKSYFIGVPLWIITFLLITIMVWSLVWKGVALWKASQKKSLIWFVILLVVNTAGILEILYIFVFSKMSGEYYKKPAVKRRIQKSRTKPKKRR